MPSIPPIPVGCTTTDCCPGCPAREAIDWRIRLAGDTVESVVLEFEDLPADTRAHLRIEGAAGWADERRLEISPGAAFVRGFPREPAGRAPVAVPRIGRLRGGLERIRDTAGAFDFSVEQFVGRVRVNEFRLRYRLIDCLGPLVMPPSSDIVRLDNNVSNDQAVVLLDARRSTGCVNDEVWRGAGSIQIGNALSNAPCPSTPEVVVFSNHNAMQLLPGVAAWTDASGDELAVALTPHLQVPVMIFVVKGPFTTAASDGNGDAADAEVVRANDLYGPMNCGLTLQPTIVDATANPNAPSLLTRKCSEAGSLRAQIGFTPGRVNVYYIEDVQREDTGASVRGATCGLVLASPTPEDRNTILVSTTYAEAETLAHELGHAFSLRDSNPFSDLDPDDPAYIPTSNLMHSGGAARNTLTEGQCFRVNVNSGSALNLNGVRTGPTRLCPDGTTSTECPALSLDVDPNN